ncbi:MAG: (2Fe-2S)-binding protein [Thioalkalispiraceae bacterium]|jgi:aerobic-type carbon monoxide dehydrogenase small subunit (CoxS/CutS family)
MSTKTFRVNKQTVNVTAPDDMPLLWVLRDRLQLTGTHYGCGIGQCGSCIVHVNGELTYSCMLPFSALDNADILTIEGLSDDNSHPVQRAWIEEEVPQCGYCQSGQIMAAIALLAHNPQPSDIDIDNTMRGVLCRCGTYPRIRKAIHRASQLLKDEETS